MMCPFLCTLPLQGRRPLAALTMLLGTYMAYQFKDAKPLKIFSADLTPLHSTAQTRLPIFTAPPKAALTMHDIPVSNMNQYKGPRPVFYKAHDPLARCEARRCKHSPESRPDRRRTLGWTVAGLPAPQARPLIVRRGPHTSPPSTRTTRPL